MKRSTSVLVAALLFAVGATSAYADSHKDEEIGFSVIAPRKWKSMPLPAGDYKVARFESNREYEAADPQGWYTMHRPWMEVVVLPLQLIVERKATTVEETKDKVKIKRQIPWRNLKEYLKDTCEGSGGFYFASEEETTIDDMTVRQYEIVIEKLVNAPRRVIGWEFEYRDALFCLVAEMLRKEEDKLKPMIISSFKTFKAFERTGQLPHTDRDGDTIELQKDDSNEELTEEQLIERRQQAFEQTLEKIKDNLPRDWRIMDSKNFVAVSHADARYTKELLRHAEALRDWLEDNLGYVGSGYAGRVIIRIFADDQEHSSFQAARDWFRDVPEVLTYKDKEGWSDWAMESLTRGLYNRWMRDKNKDLAWGMPSWLSLGLSSFVEELRLKGRRMEFRPDTWSSVEMKNARRGGTLLTPRDFFTKTSNELDGFGTVWQQSPFFVQFLMVGSASRSSKYRNVLSNYLKNLIFILAEERDRRDAERRAAEKKGEAPQEKQPQTEAEEDAMFKERQNEWKKKEKEALDNLSERTFPDWDDKDWEKFNQLYLRDLK